MNRYYTCIAVIALLALIHQVLQKWLHIQLPLLHAYLDDILCIPLFLAIWQWERKKFWQQLTISKLEIVSLVVTVFVLFEGVLPCLSAAYTADWLDGLAYLSGGGIYWWLQALAHNTLTLADGKKST